MEIVDQQAREEKKEKEDAFEKLLSYKGKVRLLVKKQLK